MHIRRTDKLNILFKCNTVFTVYRARDGASAILKDVEFRQPNPPAMLDGGQFGVLMQDAGITLMYAIAVVDWREDSRFKLCINDVVLLLAKIQGPYYVAITQTMKVGILPSEVVNIITMPRRFLRSGMMLKMRHVHSNTFEELFKDSEKLFLWHTRQGKPVPLQSFKFEEGVETVSK